MAETRDTHRATMEVEPPGPERPGLDPSRIASSDTDRDEDLINPHHFEGSWWRYVGDDAGWQGIYLFAQVDPHSFRLIHMPQGNRSSNDAVATFQKNGRDFRQVRAHITIEELKT